MTIHEERHEFCLHEFCYTVKGQVGRDGTEDNMQEPMVQKIAVIGGYLPRQCGIATFTTDLCESLAREYPDASVYALPMNDISAGYDYPDRVRFELGQDDMRAYHQGADFLNHLNVDVISLQHEYGIFGGPAGSYILTLMREVRAPIVTTLHSVLSAPDRDQRYVMDEIVQLSDRIVVMSERGVTMLREIYGVPAEKIVNIPHGITDVPFVDTNYYKDLFQAEGKEVLLTFGLLSENKGIEYVIAALPEIVKHHPNVLYLLVGATHPHVRRQDGEAYRERLEKMAEDLGVANHVRFYNEFVNVEKLTEFIEAADLYITPYLNEAQITSGTLAFTVGAGKAVISTAYWHAQELLAEDRGILVPFRDSAAIAAAAINVLDHDVERHAMRKRAYMYGRDMTWSNVARTYGAMFMDVQTHRGRVPQANLMLTGSRVGTPRLPTPNLTHLQRMTDDTGLLQHAVQSVPNYFEGYSIDDNARALIATVMLETLSSKYALEADRLGTRYMAFIAYALNPENGRFRNFMSYDRKWLEDEGSTDSHCRTLWALGAVLSYSHNASLQGVAADLFERALPVVIDFPHMRSWAFALLGIDTYLQHYAGDRLVKQQRAVLAERLFAAYQEHQQPGWLWFEDKLTYDNATLSRALLRSGTAMGRDDMVAASLTSLAWLCEIQRPNGGHLVPIGCQGFYERGGERACYDQQPIEAYSTVAATLDAYRLTKDKRWGDEARVAFDWFLGKNDLQLPIVNLATGGCFDGLTPVSVNRNQGAESTLAFILSLLDMQLAEEDIQDNADAMALLQNNTTLADEFDVNNIPFIIGSDRTPIGDLFHHE